MSIQGIGVDIVKVERIERLVKRWKDRFLNWIFTKEEIDYCMSKNNSFIHLAGRFAAKEAVIKALGGQRLGLSSKLRYIQVIQNNFSGAPEVQIFGPIQALASRLQISNIMITISHTKEYAVAQAICLKEV
jgi:holo-[acyl-carrier protein] synthase